MDEGLTALLRQKTKEARSEYGHLAGERLRKTSEPLVGQESSIVQESGRRSWLLIGHRDFASRKLLMSSKKVFGCLGDDA